MYVWRGRGGSAEAEREGGWTEGPRPACLPAWPPLAQSPSGHSGVRSRCTAQLPLSPPLAPDPGGGTQRRLQSCPRSSGSFSPGPRPYLCSPFGLITQNHWIF
ncbi:hypothetical protein Pmani_015759 [Petrolisthes manimaculis]|uniref:Uncharacterized protein n=1 Tax=Petrolisthes manimaculis TaxID=1843537 RepID=A0AAE1PT58_9EUCA|nr:hypothetical protein Pmani_015759 [Petrolisthes manimaculis]